MSHPHPHHSHAHSAEHGHEHTHGAARHASVAGGSWLLRSAAWRLGMAVLACALVLSVVAWAMTAQG